MSRSISATASWPTSATPRRTRTTRFGPCGSGLDIVESIENVHAHGRPIHVRVGIHTGLVVVGDLLGTGRSEPLALGETPNLAARVQTEAEPDSVLITETTRRLVAGHFMLEDQGERTLKGIAHATRLFRVLGRSGATRFDAIAESGLTPFVGREEEVDAIQAAWHATLSGKGQTLVLRGEPGIGKSRLLGVARDAVRRTGHEIFVAECSPHNVNSSLFPVVEMLQRRLGFDSHPEAEKLGLLEEFVRARGLTDDSLRCSRPCSGSRPTIGIHPSTSRRRVSGSERSRCSPTCC